MSTKNRLSKAEKAIKIAKPSLNVALLKPSEIARRVRAILAESDALASGDVLQTLKSLEQVNHEH